MCSCGRRWPSRKVDGLIRVFSKPVAKRWQRQLTFPRLAASSTELHELSIAPQMRLDNGQPQTLGAGRSFLWNQQALRIEIAEIEHSTRATEFVEDVGEIADAVGKTIAIAIDDGTEQHTVRIPAAVGVPCRGVLNHDERLTGGTGRAALPRERHADDFAPKSFFTSSRSGRNNADERSISRRFSSPKIWSDRSLMGTIIRSIPPCLMKSFTGQFGERKVQPRVAQKGQLRFP